MTKWNQLRHQADEKSGEEIERDMWSLSEDPRFPSLLALLADVRSTRLTQGSGVASANDHGVLAHCLGSVDAIDELEARLKIMVEPPPKEEKT
jgi:hypothetical protein